MQSSYNYKQLQAYQQARLNVGKAQQVVLLYDGMIRFLQQAHTAYQTNDIASRCDALTKAITIVMGLQSCLDMENYPEISATLYDYYETLYVRMYGLQQGINEEEYESLITDVKQMRDAWVATEEASPPVTSPVAAIEVKEESFMPSTMSQHYSSSENVVYSA
jgi:flagellar secretion chaperone FliS